MNVITLFSGAREASYYDVYLQSIRQEYVCAIGNGFLLLEATKSSSARQGSLFIYSPNPK